jgi:hypothetical protein
MKTTSLLALFALASVSLAGCAIAPADANKDGTIPGSSASPSPSASGDLVAPAPTAPVAPPAVVSTTTAVPAPAVSPGTLVSCYSFDVATTTDGASVGVCAPTTATGKPRYLRAYSIVTVVSPVTNTETSILVGIE